MKKKALLAALIAAVIAFALAMVGCGSDGNDNNGGGGNMGNLVDSSTPADIEIVDWGGTIDDDGWVHWGVKITNPNAHFSTRYANVEVVVRDANDAIIGSDSLYISIDAGQTIGCGDYFNPDGDADSIEASVSVADDEWIHSDMVGDGTVEISNIEESFDYADDYYYTYRITSSLSDAHDYVQVTALFYNEDGEIVGGAYDYVDNYPNSTFNDDLVTCDESAHASYELFVACY